MTNKTSTRSGIITALADLPADAYLDARALGDLLGCCKRSVERAWRRGELPSPIRFMGRYVWVMGAIREHLQEMQKKAIRMGLPGTGDKYRKGT